MSLNSVARQYIQAATYIDIPNISILYELSIRNHHTSFQFIYEVSMESIQEDHCNHIAVSCYPNEYTLNALITHQIRINRSVDKIHNNLVRWTNGWILFCDLAKDYTVDRIWLRLGKYNRHVKLLYTQKVFTETFKRDYILSAHSLGFSINQIISHLLSRFPKEANSFTSELIYSVLAKHYCEFRAMTVGRRKWDSAGDKFVQAARNLGICKGDVYCALIMARYDVECDVVEIEQAWNTEVVEDSSATTPQVTLPVLVRAPAKSITARDEVEYDVVETATETGEDEVNSFAGTSTEDSYPIIARTRKNSTTPENDLEPDDEAEVAETGKDDAKSFAHASTEDSYPVMAPPPNSRTAGNDVPHGAAIVKVEAGENKAKSFASTLEDSYPIMARALASRMPKETNVQREDAGEIYW